MFFFKIINLFNIKINNVDNMNNMFYKCFSLTSLNLSNFNTNNVTNIHGMFNDLNMNCKVICNDEKIDFNSYVDKYNTLKIQIKEYLTNMSRMFNNCSSLTSLNLSNFNTNNVTNMIGMFWGINKDCNLISNDKKILNQFK